MEIALFSLGTNGIVISSYGILSDLEYADHPNKLQAFLFLGKFGMPFAPSKCEMLC